jgi:hypothetical protein
MNAALMAVVTLAMSASLAAQWLNHPTPGIPRTADGKPNLAAPAPRTSDGKPDLSGLWNKVSPKYSRNIAADLKPEDIQPWARALVEQRKEDLGRQYMNVLCVPIGPGYATSADSTGAEMIKIVQTPALILILNPDLTYRQIFLDGRELESAPNPSWMGYRWALGRRHTRRGKLRLQRSHVARSMAIHTLRKVCDDRTLPPPQLRQPRGRGDVLGSGRLREALDRRRPRRTGG